jgi:hypothetical protein
MSVCNFYRQPESFAEMGIRGWIFKGRSRGCKRKRREVAKIGEDRGGILLWLILGNSCKGRAKTKKTKKDSREMGNKGYSVSSERQERERRRTLEHAD